MKDKQSDSEEEDFVYPPHPKLPLAFSNNTKYPADTLFIATYGAASLFLHSLKLVYPPIDRLNFSKAKQQSLADLHTFADNKNLALIFNDQQPNMKQIYFYKFIKQNIIFNKIVLLDCLSRNTLRNVNHPKISHISTSHWQQKHLFGQFQEGVSGILGEIISNGQINQFPATLIIVAIDQYELSSQIVQSAFGTLRGKMGLTGHSEIGDRVKKYNMSKKSSKLYL